VALWLWAGSCGLRVRACGWREARLGHTASGQGRWRAGVGRRSVVIPLPVEVECVWALAWEPLAARSRRRTEAGVARSYCYRSRSSPCGGWAGSCWLRVRAGGRRQARLGHTATGRGRVRAGAGPGAAGHWLSVGAGRRMQVAWALRAARSRRQADAGGLGVAGRAFAQADGCGRPGRCWSRVRAGRRMQAAWAWEVAQARAGAWLAVGGRWAGAERELGRRWLAVGGRGRWRAPGAQYARSGSLFRRCLGVMVGELARARGLRRKVPSEGSVGSLGAGGRGSRELAVGRPGNKSMGRSCSGRSRAVGCPGNKSMGRSCSGRARAVGRFGNKSRGRSCSGRSGPRVDFGRLRLYGRWCGDVAACGVWRCWVGGCRFVSGVGRRRFAGAPGRGRWGRGRGLE